MQFVEPIKLKPFPGFPEALRSVAEARAFYLSHARAKSEDRAALDLSFSASMIAWHHDTEFVRGTVEDSMRAEGWLLED